MGADAHVDHGEIFDTEVCRIQTTDDSKTTTGVHFLTDVVQLWPQSGQQKVVLIDLGAVKAEILVQDVSPPSVHKL